MKNRITEALLLIALLHTPLHAQAARLLDRIVAIVDEQVITQYELEQRSDEIKRQLRAPVTDERQAQALRKQVLDRMIIEKIQLQMAARMGISIDDIALNRTLERLAATNNLDLDGLRRALETDGIRFERFREQTRKELVIQQLQQRLVANKVTVSDLEIEQMIADSRKQEAANLRYKLRHILVGTPGEATPEQVKQAREKVDRILQRLQDGDNFSQVAVEESSGRNALQGGDLGWRARSELPESFVAALAEISINEVTAPIRSPSGFHLLLIEDSSEQRNTVIQTLARHILIRSEDALAAKQELSELRARILQGEDFGELAAEYSDDTSKENGGELGWADPGTFVPQFESTMQTLEIGEVSEPFLSQFGWHIVQVMDRRENDAAQDALAKQARQQIRSRKIDEELRLWLQQIRDEAYVELVDNELASN